MELHALIDEYLESLIVREYAEKTIARYKHVLEIFYGFAVDAARLQHLTVGDFLNSVSVDGIVHSIDYYIRWNTTLSEYTVRLYISVVREITRYLKSKKVIDNKDLLESFALSRDDINSFVYKTNDYISVLIGRKSVTPGSDIMPLSDENIEVIVRFCDDILRKFKKLNVSKYAHNRFVKAIATKLIVYLGVSVEVINKIKYSDVDMNKGTMRISGYDIHIPYNLRRQLEVYVDIACKDKSASDCFLTMYNGDNFDQANEIGTFIKSELEKMPDVERKSATTCIVKYAIIQLIDAGIDRDTIMELNDHGDDIYDDCREYIENLDSLIKSRKLDARLKTIRAFDYL